MQDKKPTKKGWKLLAFLLTSGMAISVISLKLHVTDVAWVGVGILVILIIVMVFIQQKPIGWHGLTKERKC